MGNSTPSLLVKKSVAKGKQRTVLSFLGGGKEKAKTSNGSHVIPVQAHETIDAGRLYHLKASGEEKKKGERRRCLPDPEGIVTCSG